MSTRADSVLLGFAEYEAPAKRLATSAGLTYGEVRVHHFPDGESRITVPSALPPNVVLCRSLNDPNDKLIELLLAASAARTAGAETLSLVAPYLCYMRQDKAFHDGEAISQRVIGELLARGFDAVVTVDPHLHRVRSIAEAIPTRRAVSLHATGPIAHFIAGRVDGAFLLGPDAESEQWVRAIADVHRLPYAVGQKRRLGDRSVAFTAPERDFGGRHVVLVDDVASTGRTLEAAARVVTGRGARSVSTVVTHGLFLEDAEERLRRAGIEHIWSTDSIPHPTNAIELAPVLAEVLNGMLSGEGGAGVRSGDDGL